MGNEHLTWIDPAGVATLLDGSGNFRGMMGRGGFDAPPMLFIEQNLPLDDGMRLLLIKADVNSPRVPLLIKANSEADLITARRNLRTAMNPKRGLGKLQFQAADATTRYLNCAVASGLEGDESDGNRGPGWMMAPLVFRAQDPYWYDVNPTLITYSATAPTAFFPILPLQLSSSSVFSGFSVQNMGDVEMWPKWTIHGPGTNPLLTNTTTGKSITLTIVLGSSDVLTIDTTPGVKTILLNGVTNEYSALNISSSLWSFPTGTNAVTVSLTSTGAGSAITLQYQQRWLGV